MMRALIIAGTFALLGATAATAQPWHGPGYGYPPPPPPPPYAFRGPPPPVAFIPPPYRHAHGYGYDGGRRCGWRPTPWGPERVCRSGW